MKKLVKTVKWSAIIILVIILVPVIIILSARGINLIKYRIDTETGIRQEIYVTLNGAEQFISIRGDDKANPVILFLHGGPARPLSANSPYFQTNLEDDYTIVHWDQRGSGRTYYRNETKSSVDELSTELLLDDLDELVDYLREKFGQEKIIIMGHSWGTVLGTHYVLEYPEKVSDYIAIGYVVNLRDGHILSAKEALALAKKAENTDDVNDLQEAITSFSSVTYENSPTDGSSATIKKICSKYLTSKGEMSFAGQVWVGMSSPYANIEDFMSHTLDHKKIYSLIAPLIDYLVLDYDANSFGYNFEIPVYIIQGGNDWRTPAEPVQEYFDKINAPEKELVIVKNSGHNSFFDYPEEFGNIVKDFLE